MSRVRRIEIPCLVLLMIGLAASLPGCNGVVLSAEYSKLLDQTADLSAETARRAQAGTLPAGDMRDALIWQAYVWRQFKHGHDGTKADALPEVPEVDTPPATQPTNLTDLAPAPS